MSDYIYPKPVPRIQWYTDFRHLVKTELQQDGLSAMRLNQVNIVLSDCLVRYSYDNSSVANGRFDQRYASEALMFMSNTMPSPSILERAIVLDPTDMSLRLFLRRDYDYFRGGSMMFRRLFLFPRNTLGVIMAKWLLGEYSHDVADSLAEALTIDMLLWKVQVAKP